MPHAVYTIRCSHPWDAEALHGALAVDADDGLGGSVISLEPDPTDRTVFRIRITSEAVGSLRAATNSFLKRLKAAAGTLQEPRP